jgi:hypothetical protein
MTDKATQLPLSGEGVVPREKDAFMAGYRGAWADLQAAIKGVGRDHYDSTVGDGSWRLRDILGHIATYDRVALAGWVAPSIERATIDPLVIKDFEAYNQAQQLHKANWPMPRVLGEFEAAHRALTQALPDFIDRLTEEIGTAWDERFDRAGWVWLNGPMHYADHAVQIREWRRSRGDSLE